MIHPGHGRYAVAGLLLAGAFALLAGCDGPEPDDRPTHVVCHSGGVRVLDDFGGDPGLLEGGIKYKSRTTGRYVRVTGDCAAFNDAVPDGWKPVLPGMSRDIAR